MTARGRHLDEEELPHLQSRLQDVVQALLASLTC